MARCVWLGAGLALLAGANAHSAVVAVTGTVVQETSPYPPASDTAIFVFNERQRVPFVATQPLDFGSIPPGTLVNSHYVQFDPISGAASIGTGSITFRGPVVGVITQTARLTAGLSPDAAGTSDTYFGLEDDLGPYPSGAVPSARGLGSAEDDLLITLDSPTLVIDSLEIPAVGAGNIDGFRVLTRAPLCVGDVDGDGDTDVFDFADLASNFGVTGLQPYTGGDLDGNGGVDVFDFAILASDFGCDEAG